MIGYMHEIDTWSTWWYWYILLRHSLVFCWYMIGTCCWLFLYSVDVHGWCTWLMCIVGTWFQWYSCDFGSEIYVNISNILRRVLVHVVGVFNFVGTWKEEVQVGYRIVAQVDYKLVAQIGTGLQQYISQWHCDSGSIILLIFQGSWTRQG